MVTHSSEGADLPLSKCCSAISDLLSRWTDADQVIADSCRAVFAFAPIDLNDRAPRASLLG